MARSGWSHSQETRAKMSATRKGRALSESHKAAISAGQRASDKAQAGYIISADKRRGITRGGRTERERSLARYGLTLADYDSLLESQNGRCAICDQPESARRRGVVMLLAVDHDHETGRVRGLLCSRCNIWLGVIDKLKRKGLLDAMEGYLA